MSNIYVYYLMDLLSVQKSQMTKLAFWRKIRIWKEMYLD